LVNDGRSINYDPFYNKFVCYILGSIWREEIETKSGKMRLFIGLILPSKIRDELFKVHKKISPDISKIKWISKKNLHLTLKFLGDVEKDVLSLIIKKLNKIKFDPFEVRLGNLNFFAKNGYVKIIWTEIIPKKEIIKLQQKIDQELLDIFKFDQNFSPHLTLGRVKKIKKKEKFTKMLNDIKISNAQFKINNFYLIESKLTKDGSNYVIFKEFNK
tara:strand:+ start:1083 stop:1727 length:645 start_codon:yes stop_codon:yes gene_type:complete